MGGAGWVEGFKEKGITALRLLVSSKLGSDMVR